MYGTLIKTGITDFTDNFPRTINKNKQQQKKKKKKEGRERKRTSSNETLDANTNVNKSIRTKIVFNHW